MCKKKDNFDQQWFLTTPPFTAKTFISPRRGTMKKIICLFLSFNLTFANLENFNVGIWNLQGSSAATKSEWSISVRQLVSGANPLDILMIQEAGTLPRTATPTGRHVEQGGIPIDEYEWNLGTLSRPDRVFIYYSRVDVGTNRVNLAIVSRMQAEEVICFTSAYYSFKTHYRNSQWK